MDLGKHVYARAEFVCVWRRSGTVRVRFARGLRLTACRRVCLAATGGVCYRVERYAVLSRPNYLQLCDTTKKTLPVNSSLEATMMTKSEIHSDTRYISYTPPGTLKP